jgi:hypothetical protein
MNVESILPLSFPLALVASARDRNRVDMAGQDDSVNGRGNNVVMARDCSKWPNPRQLLAASSRGSYLPTAERFTAVKILNGSCLSRAGGCPTMGIGEFRSPKEGRPE